MSIWRHITDIELQRLKEAHRALQREREELTELERTYQETNLKLYSAQQDLRDYEELAVQHAVGQQVELPPMPQSEAQLRLLLTGLNRRVIEKRNDIKTSKYRYDTLARATLSECVARAADVYRGQAEVLAETWQDINTASAAMESPLLGWRDVFIPALPGMRGATENFSRPCLFDGRKSDVAAMEAQLTDLLS